MSDIDDLMGGTPAQQAPQPQSQGFTWGHLVQGVINNIGRGAASTPAFAADTFLKTMFPALAPAVQKAAPVETGVDQAYSAIAGNPKPQNSVEKYAFPGAQGIGAAVAGGPETDIGALLKTVAAGATGGVAAQVTNEATGSDLASTLAGLGAALVTHHGMDIVQGIRPEVSPVAKGMAHPEYDQIVNQVIPTLEGGGTLENPKTSPKGAFGPMQVMPDTLRQPGHGITPWNGTVEDSVRVGKEYGAALLHKYGGDTSKMLAAYNWGEGHLDEAIKKYGDNWLDHAPRETQNYVNRGMDLTYGGGGASAGMVGGAVPSMEGSDLAAAMGSEPAEENIPDDTERMASLIQEHQKLNDLIDSHLQEGQDALEDIRAGDEPGVTPSEVSNYQQGVKEILSGMDENHPLYPKALMAQNVWDNVAAGLENHDAIGAKPEVFGEASDKFLGQEPKEAEPANINEPPSGGEPPQEPPVIPPGGEGSGPEGPSPQEKISQALKAADEARPEQNTSVSDQRSVRTAKMYQADESDLMGAARSRAKLAALQGEMGNVGFDNSALNGMQPHELDALHDDINDHPSMNQYEKVAAINGLNKLVKGDVPFQSELDALHKVFSPESPSSKHPVWNVIANVLGVPRAILTSGNFHALMRQGLLAITQKAYWANAGRSFGMFFNESYHRAVMAKIRGDAFYPVARKMGLAVRYAESLSDHEGFFANRFYENMPGENGALGPLVKAYNKTGGWWIRASHRAFSGFLTKLRFDIAKSWYNAKKANGGTWNGTQLKAIGTAINTLTGKGNLGKFQNAADEIGKVAFSAPLAKARVDLFNPGYWSSLYKADPFVAGKMLKAVGGSMGVITLGLALAQLSGAKVTWDPKSSDFGKIRIGNDRLDMTGGMSSYITLAAREATGHETTLSGSDRSLKSGQFGQPTRLDVLNNFLWNKSSPVLGAVRDWMKGTTPTGEKTTAKGEAENLLTPMHYLAMWKDLSQNGVKSAWKVIPMILGNIQEYDTHMEQWKSYVGADNSHVYNVITRLNAELGEQVLTKPSKTVTIDGEKKALSAKGFQKYDDLSGQIFQASMADSSAQLDGLSKPDKIKFVHKMLRDARREARQQLWGTTR